MDWSNMSTRERARVGLVQKEQISLAHPIQFLVQRLFPLQLSVCRLSKGRTL